MFRPTYRCLNCGNALSVFKRRDAKFCDSKCRADYHNRKRKFDRRYRNTRYTIRQLANVKIDPETMHQALTEIESLIQELKPNTRWECRECGQAVYLKPENGHVCDFCGGSIWDVSASQELTNN